MTEHSPEAIAAYPCLLCDPAGIECRERKIERSAYDIGAREKAAQQHATDRETIAAVLDPEAFEDVTYPGEEAFEGSMEALIIYRDSRRRVKSKAREKALALADALLAVGGPLVDVREVQAKALEDAADDYMNDADAEFIAASRTAVPALIAYARELEQRIEEALTEAGDADYYAAKPHKAESALACVRAALSADERRTEQ